MKTIMTNKEYEKALEIRICKLNIYKKQTFNMTAKIIGNTLLKEDLFFCASADRCVHLIDGMCELLKTRNLTCVGALLRLQMDNCMRTYAAFIAADKDKVVDCLISDNSINKEMSKDGYKLSDAYLKTELNNLDSKFASVYNQASGFIHLSSKAFYQSVTGCDGNGISFQVGGELPEKLNNSLLEACDAFLHFIHLHHEMLQAVADSKERYDAKYDDCES